MGDPPWEVDAGGDAFFLQGCLNRLLQSPVSANEHPEVTLVVEDGREGLDEVLDAFFSAQPSNVANEGRAVRQGGGGGEGLEIKEVAVGDEDFVAVGFEIPFSDEIWRINDKVINECIR